MGYFHFGFRRKSWLVILLVGLFGQLALPWSPVAAFAPENLAQAAAVSAAQILDGAVTAVYNFTTRASDKVISLLRSLKNNADLASLYLNVKVPAAPAPKATSPSSPTTQPPPSPEPPVVVKEKTTERVVVSIGNWRAGLQKLDKKFTGLFNFLSSRLESSAASTTNTAGVDQLLYQSLLDRIGRQADSVARSVGSVVSDSSGYTGSFSGVNLSTDRLLSVSGAGTSTFSGNLQVDGTAKFGSNSVYINNTSLYDDGGAFALNTTATSTLGTLGFTVGTNQLLVQRGSGNIGVGTTSPYARLSVVGPIVVESLDATSSIATSTVAGMLQVTKAPSLAHTFASWSSGVSGATATSAALVINPASAVADSNLFGIAVAGSARFLVDAEGDVFANGLTTAGSVTQGNTTISTLTVENNSTLGDATGDTIAVIGRFNSDLVPSAANTYNLGTSSTAWLPWKTGFFGTSVGIAGTATSTPTSLLSSASSYLIDASSTLSINTSGNQPVTFGTGKITMPYASSTALDVSGALNVNNASSSINYLHLVSATSTNLSYFSGGLIVNSASSTITNLQNVFASSTSFSVSGSAYLATTAGNTVGVGTTSPWAVFAVNPTAGAAGNQFVVGSSTATNLLVDNRGYTGIATTSSWGLFSINPSGITGPALAVGSSTATWFTIDNGGKVGIGTTTPNWNLSVAGASSFDNYARASYFIATSTTTSNLPYASSTALDVSGALNVNAASSTITNLTLVNATSTSATTTNLYVSGNTTLATSLTGPLQAVGGVVSASSTLSTVYGGTGLNSYTLGDVLYASGVTTLAGTSTANLKTTLALNSVENTALSTWTGSTNLTTLGSITTGTWGASTIGVAKGGTGATSFGQGWIYSDGGTNALSASTSPTINYFVATSTTATSTIAGGLTVDSTTLVVDYSGSRVGVGTAAPRRALDVLDASNPQLRLSQADNSLYADFQVAASTGDLTNSLTTTATKFVMNQPGGTTGANLWVCTGDACPTAYITTGVVNLTGGGNLVTENSYFFGNGFRISYVDASTTIVYDTTGTAILQFDETP